MTVDKGLGARTRTKHFGTRQRGDADYKHMKVKGTGGNNPGSGETIRPVTHEEGQVTAV